MSDRYTLERELGRGGMATVYLALDLKHDRPVALKVMHPQLAATLGAARFLREIRLCRSSKVSRSALALPAKASCRWPTPSALLARWPTASTMLINTA